MGDRGRNTRLAGAYSRAAGPGGLLAAKLVCPPLPRAFVLRRRLLDRADEGAEGEVTLVCGGPGSGKTLLVAAWAEAGRAPGPVAWLSLDAYDNDPTSFWSYVLGAIRGTSAVPERSPLARMVPGPRIDETFVRRLAGGVAGLPVPVVLVLDDLHEIDNPRILRSLAFLLRHPLGRLRLVITTRGDRVPSLHRPRTRAGLTELRAAELDFTPDEAARLLAAHDVQLTSAEIGVLLDRTEGWATGLCLAARFLGVRGAGRGVEEFTGTEPAVADYLVSEVLGGEPPEVQRFLRRTSIAGRVCGELAEVLTGEAHGQQILDRLARSNALVSTVGERQEWFRYHRLLRDLLQYRLRLETPELVADLHLKAARWLAGADDGPAAVGHAVAAADWPLVGRLMVTVVGARIDSANRRPLTDLLARVPASQLSATASLALCGALLAYDRGEYDVVPAQVARARALIADEDADLRLPAEILARALDAALARGQGDMTALVETTAEAMNLLADVSPEQLSDAGRYRATAFTNAGIGLFWTGRLGAAHTRLRSGMAVAQHATAELTQLDAMAHLALVEAERGLLRDGLGHARGGLDLAQGAWRWAHQAVPAYLALALINLERHQLSEADLALENGLAAQRADAEPVLYLALRALEVRVLLAHGETDAARLAAQRIDEEADAGRMPTTLARWFAIAEADLDLSAGEPEKLIRRVRRPGAGARMFPRLLTRVARAHLALEAFEAAEAVLAPLHASAPDVGSAVEAWLLTALVADELRQNSRSVDAFSRAVALAEAQEMRAPFVGVGLPRLGAFLERYQWLTPHSSHFVAELLTGATAEPARSEPAWVQDGEELTERELDVLRYLPTMLRNQDIAGQMYVSVNTVKAHLRSLYRKLGVTQRREAVDRARELGLL
ncbi:LuxR C-terminal-related transcriptional regulator [Actinoplanes sp. NPDC049118]|uniref:LuxR C-terminal-related transcriptional regulator n=1 Tax=Actinoplanes sp. NPDC049118 TaxID=3155769 RepID=UPI0033BFF914